MHACINVLVAKGASVSALCLGGILPGEFARETAEGLLRSEHPGSALIRPGSQQADLSVWSDNPEKTWAR